MNIFALRASNGSTWFPRRRHEASKTLQHGPKGLQEAPKRPQEADRRSPGDLRVLDFHAPAPEVSDSLKHVESYNKLDVEHINEPRKAPKSSPRGRQELVKMHQEAPGAVQEPPMTLPRGSQELPKASPKSP